MKPQTTLESLNEGLPALAFTLLEVVVGMVLMAGLVSGVVLALSSQQAALQRAAERRDACAMADRMLASWMEGVSGIPSRSFGVVDAQRRWTWHTEPIGARSLLGVPVRIIRFQIRKPAGQGSVRSSVALVQVDLVSRGNPRAGP